MIDLKEHGIGAGTSGALDDLTANYVVSADGNLNAGDLCEFINGAQVRKARCVNIASVSANIGSSGTISNGVALAAALDNNRVLVVYNDWSNAMFAAVLICNGSTITRGMLHPIDASPYASFQYINICSVDSTRVLLTGYAQNTSPQYFGLTMVLGITADNMVFRGGVTTLGMSGGYYWPPIVTKLDSTHFISGYTYNNGDTFYTEIITLNGYNVTTGPNYQINSESTYTITGAYITALDSSRALLLYWANNNNTLKAVILDITNTYISMPYYSTHFQVATGCGNTCLSVIPLDDTRVLVTYNGGVVVLNVLGNIILSKGTAYGTTTGNYYNSVRLLDANHALYTYTLSGSDYTTRMSVLTITGSTISKGPELSVDGATPTYGITFTRYGNGAYILYGFYDRSTTYFKTMTISIDSSYNLSKTVPQPLTPFVVAGAAAPVGAIEKCWLKGAAKGFTGLTPGATYYGDSSGNLTTTPTNTKIGVALSSSELLIKKGAWER